MQICPDTSAERGDMLIGYSRKLRLSEATPKAILTYLGG
jgi:hypothetical protein